LLVVFSLLALAWPAVVSAATTPPVAGPQTGPVSPAPAAVGEVAESANPDGVRNAVGFVGGWHGASGMAYRRYFGLNAVQVVFLASIFPDEESFVWTGVNYSRLLTIKRSPHGPGGWGLRAVGGASYRWQRDVLHDWKWDPDTGTGKGTRSEIISHVIYGGAGIGLQMGALDTPGLSVSLDVTATTEFRGSEFQWLIPLPSLELLYSW